MSTSNIFLEKVKWRVFTQVASIYVNLLKKRKRLLKKKFNSHRTGMEPHHGRRFIVLEHQYGRRDAMWTS